MNNQIHLDPLPDLSSLPENIFNPIQSLLFEIGISINDLYTNLKATNASLNSAIVKFKLGSSSQFAFGHSLAESQHSLDTIKSNLLNLSDSISAILPVKPVSDQPVSDPQ